MWCGRWRCAAICNPKFASGRLEGTRWLAWKHGARSVVTGCLLLPLPELLMSKWELLPLPTQPLPSLNAVMDKLLDVWAPSLQSMPAAAALRSALCAVHVSPCALCSALVCRHGQARQRADAHL